MRKNSVIAFVIVLSVVLGLFFAAGGHAMDWKKLYSDEFKDEHLVKSLFTDCQLDNEMVRIINSQGFISFPHTNITFSGKMTAKLVRHLYESGVERVVALGIIHGLPSRKWEDLKGGFLWSKNFINTPFGQLPIIKLENPERFCLRVNDDYIEKEFSLDSFFALMKFYARENNLSAIPVLPIFMKFSWNYENDSYDIAKKVAELLRQLADGKTAFVCTGDMFHYGHGYSFPEYMEGKPISAPDLKRYFMPKVKRILELALREKKYDESIAICDEIINDQQQLLPIISEYLGSGDYHIFEFELSDYSATNNKPKPCCVASVLAGFYRKN